MLAFNIRALERQVEGYCRQWLEFNKTIPFIYAVTCVSTSMRVWVVERHRPWGTKNPDLRGLWSPDERTWDEYRDLGLEPHAGVLKCTFDLMKESLNSSDKKLTTSEAGSREERAGDGSRKRTESKNVGDNGERRTDRSRSRSRAADPVPKPPKYSRKKIQGVWEQSSQQSSTSHDVARKARDTSPESGDNSGSKNSTTTSNGHQRHGSPSGPEQLPSSSAEVTLRALPKPHHPSDPRKKVTAEETTHKSGTSSQSKDGKKR